jgi:hypothetical protein
MEFWRVEWEVSPQRRRIAYFTSLRAARKLAGEIDKASMRYKIERKVMKVYSDFEEVLL